VKIRCYAQDDVREGGQGHTVATAGVLSDPSPFPDISGPLLACLATLLCRPSTFTFRYCVKLRAERRPQARLAPRLRVLISNEGTNSNEGFTKHKALVQNVDITTHLCSDTITTTTFGSTGLRRSARIGLMHVCSCLSKSRADRLTMRVLHSHVGQVTSMDPFFPSSPPVFSPCKSKPTIDCVPGIHNRRRGHSQATASMLHIRVSDSESLSTTALLSFLSRRFAPYFVPRPVCTLAAGLSDILMASTSERWRLTTEDHSILVCI
jgi:hypothetical protein